MRPLLAPDTRIIAYRNYLNDLPLYLQQRQHIIVIDRWHDPDLMSRDNWRREFYLGLRDHPEAAGWLRPESDLPSLLAGPSPFLLLVRRSELAHVPRHYDGRFPRGCFDRICLFSNPPPQ
jgi:hypothetical protein